MTTGHLSNIVRRDAVFLVLGALFIALLCLGPHAAFSMHIGEFNFFKGAYDEDTYGIFAADGNWQLYRLLSSALITGLLWFGAGSFNFALVALDGILPAFVFLAAYSLGSAFLRESATRYLFAMAMVFAPDLLSLGDVATPLASVLSISTLKSWLGTGYASLVPDITTSYLNIMRSAEPQASYIVGFCMLAWIVQAVRWPDRPLDTHAVTGLVILQALLMISYVFVSVPVYAVELGAAVILAACGAWKKAGILACLGILSIAGMALNAVFFAQDDSVGLIFRSHLPTLTASVLVSLPLLTTVSTLLVLRKLQDRMLWLSLLLLAAPVALTNQQIVTGLQISTRDWERYITAPLLLLGCAIALSRVSWSFASVRARHIAGAVAIVGIALFAVSTQVRSYGFWLPDNLRSTAIARAVGNVDPSFVENSVIVLDEPGLAPLVQLRIKGKQLFAIDYTELFRNPIASLRKRPFVLNAQAWRLFEYWRLVGVGADAAAGILQNETARGNGYYSAFLFNICDYWEPCTDGRAMMTDEITVELPGIIDAYDKYLAVHEEAGVGPYEPLFLYNGEIAPARLLGKTPVGKGRAGNYEYMALKLEIAN